MGQQEGLFLASVVTLSQRYLSSAGMLPVCQTLFAHAVNSASSAAGRCCKVAYVMLSWPCRSALFTYSQRWLQFSNAEVAVDAAQLSGVGSRVSGGFSYIVNSRGCEHVRSVEDLLEFRHIKSGSWVILLLIFNCKVWVAYDWLLKEWIVFHNLLVLV